MIRSVGTGLAQLQRTADLLRPRITWRMLLREQSACQFRPQFKRDPLGGSFLLNIRDWLLGTVRSTLLILASTAVGVTLVTACNDTVGPRPSVTVSVLTQPTPSYAADSAGRQFILCEVGLQARNGGQESAGWMDATFAFYAVNDSRTPFGIDTIPADIIRLSWGADSIGIGQNSDETARWDVSANIPFTLKIRFAYGWANGSVAFSEVLVSCKPPTPAGPPPTITTLRDQVDTAPEPSDILHVSYAASSAVGLWQSFIQVTGPCDVTVFVPEGLQLAATHDVGVQLPAACSLGVPVRVTATVFDLGLQQTSRSVTLPALVDNKAPSLAGSISTPYSEFDGFFPLASFTGYVFTGDPISVFVRVADNHAVHRVYWEVLPAGQRDSLLANDSSDFIDTVRIQTQASWTGTIQLRFWTKDGSGNVSDTIASQPGAIQVFPTVGSSPTLTSIPGRISDVAFDEKRGAMYLLQSRSISVFSPTSLSIVRTIALPDTAPGFDVSPSGDSIITVLANSRALGIVDLTQASPALQIVPLALDSSLTLLDVRVAATGRVVISTENMSDGVERLYTYDLASGTLRVRSDAPGLGQYGRGLLERSTDGNVVVANGFAGGFVRYDAATDAFGPSLSAQTQNAQPALDSNGVRVAVFGDLYDSSLHYLFTIAAAHRGPGLSAFSPDGQTHYMAIAPTYVQGIWSSPGIVRSHVSDGSIIDRIPVVMLTTLVRVSPDGSLLAAVEGYNPGPARIALINLSQLH